MPVIIAIGLTSAKSLPENLYQCLRKFILCCEQSAVSL